MCCVVCVHCVTVVVVILLDVIVVMTRKENLNCECKFQQILFYLPFSFIPTSRDESLISSRSVIGFVVIGQLPLAGVDGFGRRIGRL